MSRIAPQILLLGLLALAPATRGAEFFWTGNTSGALATGANWNGGIAPPNDSTASLVFNTGIRTDLSLTGSLAVNSLTFSSMLPFSVASTPPDAFTLGIGGGGLTLTGVFVDGGDGESSNYTIPQWVDFTAGLPLQLLASQTWTVSDFSFLSVAGGISGTSGNHLTLAGNGLVQLFGDNTYAGGTDINGPLSIDLATATAFGTGKITINHQDVRFRTVNGDLTLDNAIDFKATGTTPYFHHDGYYGSLTLNGPITLFQNLYLGLEGSQPLVITGSIGESGGSRSLVFDALTSTLVLSGSGHTYTGGTIGNTGHLLFSSLAAVPATGVLRAHASASIGLLSNNFTGGQTLQADFIDRFDKAGTSGTISFDTPDAMLSANVFSDAIDLTGFGAGARLGSTSRAKLTGVITPQDTSYRFGNGGGILEIASNLTGARSLVATSEFPLADQLLVRLSGTNDYTGGTTVFRSGIIFTTPAAIPATGSLTLQYNGYIGLQLAEDVPGTGSTTVPDFLGHFATPQNSSAAIGFDSADVDTLRTINAPIDFTAGGNLNASGFALGTSTNVAVAGLLTVPFGYNFVGYRGGHLAILSTLSGTKSVTIGDGGWPLTIGDSRTGVMSTVTLSGDNTYSGGTYLRAGRLIVGQSNSGVGINPTSALGSGTLSIEGFASIDYSLPSVRLETAHSGTIIPNAIALQSNLELNGSNSFTLSGNITGVNESYFSGHTLQKFGSGAVTLSGNNSFSGGVYIGQGNVTFSHDRAAGYGPLGFGSTGGSATFTTSSPFIGGLFGYDPSHHINLATDSTLYVGFQQQGEHVFRGTIAGTGASVRLVASEYEALLVLSGANTYSGGTVIERGGVVAENASALGSGTITIGGESEGFNYGLLLPTSGVTLTNPLTVIAGTLAGYGTFNPAARPVVGDRFTLAPGGLYDSSRVGQLNFGPSGLAFAPDGRFELDLQNATGSSGFGWDTLAIAGALDITATTARPFTVSLQSLTFQGGECGTVTGFASGNSYAWQIGTATGGITGFDTAALRVDLENFNSPINHGEFFTTVTGNNLLLNFAPAYQWTGLASDGLWISPTNWEVVGVAGNAAPPSNATSTIAHFGAGPATGVHLGASQSVRTLSFGTDNFYDGSEFTYRFGGGPGVSLTIGAGGIVFSDSYYTSNRRVTIDASLPLQLSGAQTWKIGNSGTVQIDGTITSSSLLTIDADFGADLRLNGANALTGGVQILGGTLHLGHNSALGTSAFTIDTSNYVTLAAANGNRTLSNAISTLGTSFLNFDGAEGSLTLTGPLTLTDNLALSLTGAGGLNLNGPISAASGTRNLVLDALSDAGPLTLGGANTYNGDTTVYGGRLIFTIPAAFPAGGILHTHNNSAYLGVAFNPANLQADYLGRIATARGTIGFDTPAGASTVNFTGGFTVPYFGGEEPYTRLGSATSAILSGTITPHASGPATYLFGGGGGRLTVTSELTGSRNVAVESPTDQPLLLTLAGNNSFTGDITVTNSSLVLDSPTALPAGRNIVFGNGAARGTTFIGSYAGYTENFDNTAASFANFFNRVTLPGAVGGSIIGIDSATSSPRTITNQAIDLTRAGTLTGAVMFGTSSSVILGSNVTFTLPAGNNGQLLLAGVSGGRLQFDGPFNSAVTHLTIGYWGYGNDVRRGILDLRAANTFSNSTTLISGTLALGDKDALGTSLLAIETLGHYDYAHAPHLVASVAGLTGANSIGNSIALGGPLVLGQAGNSHAFTLGGNISGHADLFKEGPANIALGGVSSSFDGRFHISGPLTLASDNAAGFSELILDTDAVVGFTSASPRVYALEGHGTVNLSPATALTVEIAGAHPGGTGLGEGSILGGGFISGSISHFAGTINGATGSLVKAGGGVLELSGTNTYGGGTTINEGMLIVGSSSALGTGSIVLNGSDALLGVRPGVTFANSLAFGAAGGVLGGNGTFASPVTVGANAFLSPGNSPGTLTFTNGLTLAPGGTFIIDLINPTGPPGTGYDLLSISGGLLDITATSGNRFTLSLKSLDASGNPGELSGFSSASSYSWTVFTTAGINGFSADKFTLNSSAFTNSLGVGQFFLSQNGNNLTLNFTAVPEPSTYALFGLGLGALALVARRRRR